MEFLCFMYCQPQINHTIFTVLEGIHAHKCSSHKSSGVDEHNGKEQIVIDMHIIISFITVHNVWS